ncbi:hypothetical protein K523DRAFT_322533 [Schizophyllum commune Tattone D]|nr:hypothetical protein K523DRAFT_322533 [Schizophyllum commune Tattone D]
MSPPPMRSIIGRPPQLRALPERASTIPPLKRAVIVLPVHPSTAPPSDARVSTRRIVGAHLPARNKAA